MRLALAKCENRLPLGDWDASGQLPHTLWLLPMRYSELAARVVAPPGRGRLGGGVS
jgi:hypothetical protein